MIPAVVEHFGLVISSFLNAVVHRDALRLRDVKIGGMLGTFLGTVSGAQGLSGPFVGLSSGDPDDYGNVLAPEHAALRSVPGRARRLAAVSLAKSSELRPAARRIPQASGGRRVRR